MPDVFNVTAALDKASYNTGDTITLTISGGDVLTSTTVTPTTYTGTVNLAAADGATSVAPFSLTVDVPTTTSTPESVKITSVTDSSGRVWTVAPTGLSATATA